MDIMVNNIRTAMEATGVKQRVIAERAGFTPSKFSNMLNGRYTAKPEEIPCICKALGISPDDLFSFNDHSA